MRRRHLCDFSVLRVITTELDPKIAWGRRKVTHNGQPMTRYYVRIRYVMFEWFIS